MPCRRSTPPPSACPVAATPDLTGPANAAVTPPSSRRAKRPGTNGWPGGVGRLRPATGTGQAPVVRSSDAERYRQAIRGRDHRRRGGRASAAVSVSGRRATDSHRAGRRLCPDAPLTPCTIYPTATACRPPSCWPRADGKLSATGPRSCAPRRLPPGAWATGRGRHGRRRSCRARARVATRLADELPAVPACATVGQPGRAPPVLPRLGNRRRGGRCPGQRVDGRPPGSPVPAMDTRPGALPSRHPCRLRTRPSNWPPRHRRHHRPGRATVGRRRTAAGVRMQDGRVIARTVPVVAPRMAAWS